MAVGKSPHSWLMATQAPIGDSQADSNWPRKNGIDFGNLLHSKT